MAFKMPGKKHVAQIPRVKQSHKKSRKGCLVCKQRRVKCDESRPSCWECSRRGTTCAYAQKAGVTNETDTSPSSIPSPLVRSPETADQDGATEVELFRHYLSHTTTTFHALGAYSERFWTSVMPALAYTSEPVRLGMLTMSALCIANDTQTDDPTASMEILQTAERYGWTFVEKSSEHMRALDDGRSEISLACSRLLTVLAFAWFGVYRRLHDLRLEHERSWTWLHLLRGTGTMYRRYEHTQGPGIDSLANPLNAREEGAAAYGSYWARDDFRIIAQSRESRFAALSEAIELQRPFLGHERSKDISSAVEILRHITDDICCNAKQSLVRCLCVWPCQVPKGFVDMLVQGNLLVLAVHAHWLMLVVMARELWFFGDMGCSGILQINEMCESSEDGGVESALLGWPMELVRHCEDGAT